MYLVVLCVAPLYVFCFVFCCSIKCLEHKHRPEADRSAAFTDGLQQIPASTPFALGHAASSSASGAGIQWFGDGQPQQTEWQNWLVQSAVLPQCLWVSHKGGGHDRFPDSEWQRFSMHTCNSVWAPAILGCHT